MSLNKEMSEDVRIDRIAIVDPGDPSVGILKTHWNITSDVGSDTQIFIHKDEVEIFREKLKEAFEYVSDVPHIIFSINGKSEDPYTLEDKVEIIEEKLSFWFMRDNHTFVKIKGNNLEEIVEDYKAVAQENPYGMVCPIIVTKNNEEIRRVGEAAHVDEKGNVDMDKWLKSVKSDRLITKFDKENKC